MLSASVPHFSEGVVVQRFRSSLALACAGLSLVVGLGAAPPDQSPLPTLTADAMFQISKVWTVQLTMSREAWTALTPVPPAVPADAPPPLPPPKASSARRQAERHLGDQGDRFPVRACRFRSRWPALRRCRRALQGERHLHVRQRARQGVAEGRPQQIREGPEAGRPHDPQPAQQHHRCQLDERSAGVPAVSGRRSAGAAHRRTRASTSRCRAVRKRYLGLYSIVENVDSTFVESRFRCPAARCSSR